MIPGMPLNTHLRCRDPEQLQIKVDSKADGRTDCVLRRITVDDVHTADVDRHERKYRIKAEGVGSTRSAQLIGVIQLISRIGHANAGIGSNLV